MNVWRIASILCVGVLCAAAASPPGPSSAPTGPAPVAEFDIDGKGEVILIPLSVGGKDCSLIFDTGAFTTALDSETFADLRARGDSIQVHTAGGEVTEPFYHPPEIFVGPILLSRCGPVLRRDFSQLRAIFGRPIVGILGLSAVNSFIVQIDYESQKLRLLSAQTLPRENEWGEVFELRQRNRNFEMPIRINGADEWVLVDTGFNGGLSMSSEVVTRVLGSATQPAQSTKIAALTQLVHARTMRLASMQIGSMDYRDVLLDESPGSATIGNDLLSRHLVTLDLPHRRLYLKPNRHFDRRDEANMSGLHLLRKNGKVVAEFVDQDSSAERAGISAGDVLVKVNDAPVDQYDMIDLGRLWRSEDGKQIPIPFTHNGQQRTVTLTLRRRI